METVLFRLPLSPNERLAKGKTDFRQSDNKKLQGNPIIDCSAPLVLTVADRFGLSLSGSEDNMSKFHTPGIF
jgi:hypothetical protein